MGMFPANSWPNYCCVTLRLMLCNWCDLSPVLHPVCWSKNECSSSCWGGRCKAGKASPVSTGAKPTLNTDLAARPDCMVNLCCHSHVKNANTDSSLVRQHHQSPMSPNVHGGLVSHGTRQGRPGDRLSMRLYLERRQITQRLLLLQGQNFELQSHNQRVTILHC